LISANQTIIKTILSLSIDLNFSSYFLPTYQLQTNDHDATTNYRFTRFRCDCGSRCEPSSQDRFIDVSVLVDAVGSNFYYH
jgi:hypothetical protein